LLAYGLFARRVRLAHRLNFITTSLKRRRLYYFER
jgi:hypothetical protein